MLLILADLTVGNSAVVMGTAASLLMARIAWIKLAGERTGQELLNIKNEIELAWEAADRAKAEEAKMRSERDVALMANDKLLRRIRELEKHRRAS